MDKLKDPLTHPLLAGFVVASLIALFIRYGISFTLYLLHTWQVSTFQTIVFYGLLFVLARAGVQGKSRRRPFMGMSSDGRGEMDGEPEQSSRRAGAYKVIWTVLAVYSVLWLTPALILYWIYAHPYPNQMIGALVALLSMITAGVYFIGNGKRFPARGDKILFFAGTCLGPAAVVFATLP
jgi:hypothetical protein